MAPASPWNEIVTTNLLYRESRAVHFLCSTFGSSGDVFPMVGLALELRRRGHRVTLLTNPHFGNLMRDHALDFEPLGTEQDYQNCINSPDLWHPGKAFAHIFATLKNVLRQQYEIHARYAGDPEVVGLSNCFGMGAFMAQDKFQLPVITVHLQPGVIWSNIEPPKLHGLVGPRWLKGWMYFLGEKLVIDGVVCPFLNPWRAELGLPPVKRVTRWWNSPTGVLCLFPDWYAPPQVDWPQPLMQADFPLWNDRSDQPLPPQIEKFLGAGDAPIVVTPGTANRHGQAYFTAALEACAKLNRRGLFLTPFEEQLPKNLPPAIAHAPYLPLDQVLPRAAAFVHHGGVGSASQGLLAGVPQVVLPLAHDQFDNAARLKAIGVGDWMKQSRLSGTRLTAALRNLLNSSAVADRCRNLQHKMTARDGLSRAASAVEQRLEFALKPSAVR